MAAGKTVKRTSWFAIWVTVAVAVVIIVVGAIVAWMNTASTTAEPDIKPTAANIDTASGAIIFGTGSNAVDNYIDFMCPICNQFEQTNGPTLSGLVDDKTITLNVHPIAILDPRSEGTQFPSRAASAMYSVAIADPGNAYAFLQAMFANQPEENSPGLTDDQIISIAERAGVAMTAALKSEITSGKYIPYVQAMTPKTPPGPKGIGTPTLVINGTYITVTLDPQTDIIANLKRVLTKHEESHMRRWKASPPS